MVQSLWADLAVLLLIISLLCSQQNFIEVYSGLGWVHYRGTVTTGDEIMKPSLCPKDQELCTQLQS